jgi:hypothetical protein
MSEASGVRRQASVVKASGPQGAGRQADGVAEKANGFPKSSLSGPPHDA